MNAIELKKKIADNGFSDIFTTLYGAESLESANARYIKAIDEFEKEFGTGRELELFSVAGRSEISGNHTDHNHGKVIAASIDLDIIAVASKREDMQINIKSEGFPIDKVDVSSPEPDEKNFFKSYSIISGMARGFMNADYKVGGYDAYTTSNVFKGSGLSSSAAFEDMVGNILNYFYNDGKIENPEIAKIAQYAENVFFGKPCGLMDQTACAVGGFVAIDFKDPKAPVIEKLDFDLSGAGYALCIVNTGGNHADLNDDYASVPAEMKSVAAHFGKEVLRDVCEKDIIAQIPALREKVGDRAIMRALHFKEENRRVAAQTEALKKNDLPAFLAGVLDSGDSSFKYLQNVYTTKNISEQGLSLALCLAEKVLKGRDGAWRVHGGGFAGTIQVFIKNEDIPEFVSVLDAAFGEGVTTVLRVRPYGAIKVS